MMTRLSTFEKSLYDLIRGLRNHKGNEKEYIQNSLKECRAEIRGQDMDLKATALLKLIYLEMFGHDMSWASFHVLEVMSSAKYLQKRVGYLGAVQSFRPDTEDLTATSITTMSLPILTLPHIITPSLAMSVLSDLLPRLNHSSPTIRKKTIVTVYRLALVYPETLRPSWPKIKERLMDENEDPSVTAAIVNVVCELGWRRPQDFLPLAPRLFELLVDSGNNWMAIKLIKLVSPSSTSLECGILGSSDESAAGEEIATLCVSKLRSMIMVEGDANLKYVALLAFNKIVLTHPYLVSQQEDVIMDCLDSADITIRLRALDLVVGMVSSENLVSIVGQLMRQLKSSPSSLTKKPAGSRSAFTGIEPAADSDDESPEVVIKPDQGAGQSTVLPDEYRIDVIGRILDMCSRNNYENIEDFGWYIDVLIQLVRYAPIPTQSSANEDFDEDMKASSNTDISGRIGDELRNVAVKVKAVRAVAVRAAESILIQCANDSFPSLGANCGALRPISWVVGEYSSDLISADDTLSSLLHLTRPATPAESLITYLQALPKIFIILAGDENTPWTAERKSRVSLLMARIIHTLETFTIHPDLEVQERAVEFSELLRLTGEAVSGQEPSSDTVEHDAPLLLTQAIPSLFSGLELNSVATDAQRNVPLPSLLDLDKPINPNLMVLLRSGDYSSFDEPDQDELEIYYHQPPPTVTQLEPAVNRLGKSPEEQTQSYQQGVEDSYLDPDIVARRRAERLERYKDDPFYIPGNEDLSGTSTPLHNILQSNNGPDLDIDAIPIMQLDLGKSQETPKENMRQKKALSTKPRGRLQVAADETLAVSGTSTPRNYDSENSNEGPFKSRNSRTKHSLLQVDSSNIGSFSLEDDGTAGKVDFEQQQREEAEMAKAMQEVERLRLEMQRANERIQAAQGVPPEGTLVKKKARKKPKPSDTEVTSVVKKKKKTRQAVVDEGLSEPVAPAGTVDEIKPKKKKKKKPVVTESGIIQNEGGTGSGA
ncbi:hypothetical protein B7463_g1683, partial [Scytalidium lignicola]